MGRPLWYLSIGEGEKSVFYNAAHHANEWITVPLLLSFAEKLARAYAEGGKIFGRSAKEIYQSAAVYIAPCVDPDGVDLVTGELTGGEFSTALSASRKATPTFRSRRAGRQISAARI